MRQATSGFANVNIALRGANVNLKRRLAAAMEENEELKKGYEWYYNRGIELCDEVEKLRNENVDLKRQAEHNGESAVFYQRRAIDMQEKYKDAKLENKKLKRVQTFRVTTPIRIEVSQMVPEHGQYDPERNSIDY